MSYSPDHIRTLAELVRPYVEATRGFEFTTWEDVPIRLASMQEQIDTFTVALALWGGEPCFEPHVANRRIAAMDALGEVAVDALSLLDHLGTDNWSFRLDLVERVTPFADPDRIARPLRSYTAHALGAWRIQHRRDLFTSLELVFVAARLIAMRTLQEPIDLLVRLRVADLQDNPDRYTRGAQKS